MDASRPFDIDASLAKLVASEGVTWIAGRALHVLARRATSWMCGAQAITNSDQPFVFSQGDGQYVATGTTTYGCVVTDTLQLLTIGMAEATAANEPLLFVHLVPNNGDFTVGATGLVPGDLRLSVVDAAGREVHTQALRTSHGSVRERVLLVGAAPGRYAVVLSDGEGRRVSRHIVVAR